ncbi:hypothetical protein GRI89_09135 [Altererythrobacter salegens]|uniref:PilZ domain-containing protein n=1 Tax=Croceibacterium salegens TaxID=1737568 RepID=A0A6I4SUW5_9SPHN|nr:hypothetical protein [Croceibacterium salegens]MXO59701.1 hypothetical protein [Croceibacterium salegens]
MMDELEQGKCMRKERRRGFRAPLKLKISISDCGIDPQQVLLTDISPFGCTIADGILAQVPQAISVELPGLDSQPATIRWVQRNGAGIAFDRPLHPSVVAYFLNSGHANVEARPGQRLPANRASESSKSRKEQILAGQAEPFMRILAKKQTQSRCRSLQGLIRRHTSRLADHRLERRYPPIIGKEDSVSVGGETAKVVNVSPSGLQVELGTVNDIGSTLLVVFEGFACIAAQVVWAGRGQVGLALPQDSIDLYEIFDHEPKHELLNGTL